MKKFIEDYYNFFIYGICIILFTLSIYNIIINVKHANFLNEKIIVTDSFSDYNEFKNNVLLIENNLAKNHNSNLYRPLNKLLILLKKDGVFRLFPKDKLAYSDLYNLNNYFIEIINDGWFSNISEIKDVDTNYYNEYVDMLVINANYVSKELLNNSNYAYSFNNSIRDNMDEEYKYILSNYQKFSYLILEISNKMGR